MKHYAEQGSANINRHTMAWLRAHASYDDAHPHEAMELVKRLAVDQPARQRARRRPTGPGVLRFSARRLLPVRRGQK